MSDVVTTLFTVAEAAARLRIHVVSVRRLIARGAIPAHKVGREWRVPLAWIESIEKFEKAA